MAVRERYSHSIVDKQQVKKRKEAEARTEVRAGRSDDQQIQRLDAAGHRANKEKKRLRAKVNKKNG